jgi:EmrB/QacA subfamily drug resistance transporter
VSSTGRERLSATTTAPVPPALRLGTVTGRGALAATILGSGMVFLDGTIVNVATARIGAEFNADFGALQWVLNAYTLPLASLILLGGSLGDHFGRRRIFLIGVVWFAVASLLCAVSINVEMLIFARALQGIGGALLTPGSLAIISATFAHEDRAAAVGAWSGLTGVSTAIGPILGGWLVQDVSWRWAFAINLPLAVAVIVLSLRYVPETRGERGRLDVPGTALAAFGLGALTFGATRAGSDGWSAVPIGFTAAGVVLLAAFVLVQHTSSHPLVPLRLFRNRCFSGTNLMTFLTYGALSAVIFVFVLHLQVSAGYGPFAAGLATLPITVALLLLSRRSGALATRIGPRLQLIAGPLVAAAGVLLMLRVTDQQNNYLLDVLPGIVVFALGLALLVAPLTATVMGSVPDTEVGIASGVNNAVARAAGLLAIAILPPLAGLRGTSYRHIPTMVHGFQLVAIYSAGLLVAAAVVVAFTVPRARRPAG